MNTNTTRMLRILHILAWILFAGLSIEAGGFITGAFFTVAKPELVKKLWLWQEVDLAQLYAYKLHYFFTVTLLMSLTALLKAWLFYLIVTILYDKHLYSERPFHTNLRRFLLRSAYLSLLIGSCCWAGTEYTAFLVKQGIHMPDVRDMRISGGDVWLFMGVILLVIAQIFKRGVEIQSEHELTV